MLSNLSGRVVMGVTWLITYGEGAVSTMGVLGCFCSVFCEPEDFNFFVFVLLKLSFTKIFIFFSFARLQISSPSLQKELF